MSHVQGGVPALHRALQVGAGCQGLGPGLCATGWGRVALELHRALHDPALPA